MVRINALNMEPSPFTLQLSKGASPLASQLPKSAGPAPSVPGTLRQEKNSTQEDQRGKKAFKGSDSNTQSSANK
eukprot:4490988-Alexandrium_andersonii.AAC.1